MRRLTLQCAGFVFAALATCVAAGPVRAATVTDIITFTDVGTYQVSGGGFYNGDATVTGSFTITFDPTQLYLTQPIAGVISNLTYAVTDDRFTPANITLNPIAYFAFDGAGTLTLSSDSGLNKNIIGTADITIGINGWAYALASGAWYSQPGFEDTLTTSGNVSIAETPLPAAVWLFGSVLAGGAGFGCWRRRKLKSIVLLPAYLSIGKQKPRQCPGFLF